MPDTPLVLPYDVEGAFLDVLKRRHVEHLAKLERLRGKRARMYEPFVTMVRMSDAGAVRLSGDTVPALLLGIIGAPTWRRSVTEEGRTVIDAVYQLGMQVTVMGERRRDVIFRRDVMTWTLVECVYERLPRGGLINSVDLVDYEPLAEGDTQRTVGDARLIWEVGVPNAVTIVGGLPADDSDWPAEAGGAPADPYDPLGPLPNADLTFTVDRTPIVE